MINKITALIPTFNNADTIQKTLENIQWVDHILVVDSFSKDETASIAKAFGAEVIQQEYANSATQKNWALQFVNEGWVLQIDTDEFLEENAEKIIRDALANAGSEVNCFRMARKNHVLGKWVRYGGIYPDYQYRLFRRGKAEWRNKEVHSHLIVEGKTEDIETRILHYGMPDISKQIKNLDRYTRYEADELKKRNRRFSWIKWLIYPTLVFLHRYIWLQGFRDGWRGFFLARYAAMYYFISQSKLKELEELGLDKSPS